MGSKTATGIFTTALVFSVLATLAMAGRLYCRFAKRVSLQWDDWLAIIAWVGFLIEMILTPASGLIKCSVLAFYRRVFISPSFSIAVYCVIALTFAWTVAFWLGWLLNLIPVSLEWSVTPNRPFRLDIPVFVVCYCVIGLVLDLVVVALPVPMLRRLHTSKKRKVKYYAFFLLWSVTCVFAVIKLAYAVQWFQWNNLVGPTQSEAEIAVASGNLELWSVAECNVSIIAACLPILGPLYKKGAAAPQLVRRASKFSLKKLAAAQQPMGEPGLPPSRQEEPVANVGTESQKFRAIWRVVAGNSNITSIIASEGNAPPPERPRGSSSSGIRVEQHFNAHVHNADSVPESAPSVKPVPDHSEAK